MKIAQNHRALMIYLEDPFELKHLAEQLCACSATFPVPAFIKDESKSRILRINSLKGFIATIRVEDFEEV